MWLQKSAAVIALLLCWSVTTAWRDEHEEAVDSGGPRVHLKQGILQGYKDTTSKERPFYSFTGVPFAKPPVGILRFKDPVPVEKWTGVLNATAGSPRCSQIDFITYLVSLKTKYLGQEDCLYLNIHTPNLNPDSKFPVMVYIHGGAFVGGGADSQEPHFLLNHDVVLVVLQFRLGVLGFLSTEDSYMPGNQALKDQSIGLRWVKNNIASFGGDPTRVTIFGESAGAACTHFHLFTPQSAGLFSRAILQSGSALCPWAVGGAHKQVTQYIGQHFNCSTEQNDTKGLTECLQETNVEPLVKMVTEFYLWNQMPHLMAPLIDGEYLPASPEELMKEGKHSKVDLMIGITKHDGGIMTGPMYHDLSRRKAMLQEFGIFGPVSLEFSDDDGPLTSLAMEIFKKYLGDIEFSEELADNVTKLFTDRHFGICGDLVALLHSDNVEVDGKKVFYYELHHKGTNSLMNFFNVTIGKDYACHGDDLFHIFPTSRFSPKQRSEDDSYISELFTKFWTNFATTGDPTPEIGVLNFRWPKFTSAAPKHFVFKIFPEIQDDYRKEIREFWTSLPTRQNKILFPEKVKQWTDESDLNIQERIEEIKRGSLKEDENSKEQKKKDEL